MKFKTIELLKQMCKTVHSKIFTKTGLVFSLFLGSSVALVSCGGGGSDSSSTSTSTSTEISTLVTSVNGASNILCGKNLQCIGLEFTILGDVPPVMSILATPWTDTKTSIIDVSKIAYVDGSNSATVYDSAGSVFSMTIDPTASIPGYPTPGVRKFSGNGLPTTPMGNFPVQPGTAAYPYYAALPGGTNPATGQVYSSAAAIGISTYPLISSIPLNPVVTGVFKINSLIIGIMLTGAPLHAEKAPDSSSNWYAPINALPNDQCFGHPYNAQYHYHAWSWKCFDQGGSGQSPVYGFALDGFPITGPRGADGRNLTNAELDECHGTTSEITMPDGIKKVTYHYVLNREYPHSIGCFRGKVNYDQALGPPGPNNYMKEGAPYLNNLYPPEPL
ncbi:YHYH protein [Polynucleobacter sp. 15G-AUS-farblos]|uniref:YHYH protein n=1 Tax=Polynucleobacter sp. 15G-AUS-farblos TaxID=2689094 RepID=UPI001C0CCFBD|nr:YHYH protein [Polynucleobacter sp. 15G-AUS-farblos]MBU3584508.1 YHYH protein [Polynucleobacter sp. 15G-AUS-farblos]